MNDYERKAVFGQAMNMAQKHLLDKDINPLIERDVFESKTFEYLELLLSVREKFFK